eukprot:jgi/Mesvir1/22710/Mv25459-RA.1
MPVAMPLGKVKRKACWCKMERLAGHCHALPSDYCRRRRPRLPWPCSCSESQHLNDPHPFSLGAHLLLAHGEWSTNGHIVGPGSTAVQ